MKTHIFSIQSDEQNLEGEISLNGSNNPLIQKGEVDCCLEFERLLNTIFRDFVNLRKISGEITEFKLEIKP